MTHLAAIRERQRDLRLARLRQGVGSLVSACPGARVLLFGSLARDDWDGFSDVDPLAVAPTQAQACTHAGQAAEKALDTTALQALPLKH